MNEFLDKHIGFWSLLKTYGRRNFIKDSIVPIITAVIVTAVAFIYSDDSHKLLDKIVDLCISVLPSYLGLLVAAYTILLTLLTTEAITKIKDINDDKNNYNGKDLIRTLNSEFAICVLIAGLALFLSVLLSIISSLDIVIGGADVVNYLGILSMLFLLVFSLTTLAGLIEDLYNIGQTTTFF